MTPTDELCAAAAKLRSLTATTTDAPWVACWNGQEYVLVGPSRPHPIAEWTYAVATWEPQASEQRAECDTNDADYMAAVHPGVGAALADWLEYEADLLRVSGKAGEARGRAERALAVARAINGGAQ
ncbi:hypothetical protein [Streptomyces sp. NPDC007991]|uniref:hypothetical protein n=1 Tax=Streptomyces sp. NPDC007991 TaxID=3364803 RepID=UPI0036F01A59